MVAGGGFALSGFEEAARDLAVERVILGDMRSRSNDSDNSQPWLDIAVVVTKAYVVCRGVVGLMR